MAREPAGFHDHFSGHAADYQRSRPTYPAALFDFLAASAPRRQLAWDCGCGNGQAAVALADRFERVVATDASAEQIAQADSRPNITYGVHPAEQSPLETGSVDLLTVAQAFHWFDFDRFHAEARRVLRPDGIVALWAYELHEISPLVDDVILDFYERVVGPYWPPERRYVEERYRTIPFPYDELLAPAFAIQRDWDLNQVLAYLDTWSATRRYRAACGSDPLPELADRLAYVWGDPRSVRIVRWPIHLRVGRRSA